MSKKAADTIFEALYTLTDLRVLLRETAPLHELDPSQRKRAVDLLALLEKQVDVLRGELIR